MVRACGSYPQGRRFESDLRYHLPPLPPFGIHTRGARRMLHNPVMRKVASLLAFAVACAAQAQQISLVIARDGAEPLSEDERSALLNPTEERVAKLVEKGFERVSIDNWGVLLIDAAAPPLRDVRIERLLLTELPLDGKPIRFGSLSPDVQRALQGGYTSAALNFQFSADTLVAFQAMATFNFTGNGKSHTHSQKLAGPTYEQIKEMSGKAAPRQSKDKQEKLGGRTGAARAELVFDRRQTPEAQAELYKRCSEEISKILAAELQARQDTLREVLKRLGENHQIPDHTWTKDSIPSDVLKSLASTNKGSWSALGFESERSAGDWFDSASLGNAYVSFFVAFGDGAAISNGPVTGMCQFGTTRR